VLAVDFSDALIAVAGVDRGDGEPRELVQFAPSAVFLEPSGDLLVCAAAKDRETKGTITLALAKALVAAADKVGDLKRGEAMVKEAEGAFETAARDYKDVRTEDSTVGKEAEAELKTIKAVGVGKPAPDVEGTDLDGKKVKLSSYKGKVVVLDIWATWCGPCKAMIPHERELVKKLEGKPFVFLSVSADE